MLKPFLAALALAVTFACAIPAAQADPPPPADSSHVWVQTFADDFNGPVLDATKWNTCYWWINPDSGCTSSGNNELEWYQPGNVVLENGLLKLRAKKETILAADGKTYDYTSGMVSTGRTSSLLSNPLKFQFKYGYMEIRAQAPAGQGLWPAFFTLPSSQSWPPEIDAMEMRGSQPTSMYLTSHYTDSTGATKQTGTILTDSDWTAGFHTYAIDWNSGALYFYVDGVARWYTLDPAAIPKEPMYILANLAVGGTFPGSPDATTQFPADFAIDYIKVWQQQADTTAPTVNITAPAPASSVRHGSTVAINASATDNVGVSNVDFYVGSTKLCSDTAAPYSCSWHVPTKRGTYQLSVKAYDAAGNVGTSAETVFVS